MHTRPQDAWNKVALLKILEGAHKENRDSPADNFCIQKLGFVSEVNGRKIGSNAAFFKFYRYNYGPYSSTLANDVRKLEKLRLIDSESRELTDRGRFLLEYLQPEIEASPVARNAILAIDQTIKEWGAYRSWHIVNRVYDLNVPVDGRHGQEMRVRDIPMNTDILDPELRKGPELLSIQMADFVEQELAISAEDLDPTSPKFIESINAHLRNVHAM